MPEIGSGNAIVERDGHRADVIINRPEKRNALNQATIRDLTAAFEEVLADDEVRAIAFLGEDPVFCAGMDLGMMYEFDRDEHRDLGEELRGLFDLIDRATTPTVAGVKRAGIAGGFELTLPADFRILGSGAKYGVVEVNLGVFPSGGSTQRLPRLVGMSKAKELVLRGEFIDPEEADRIDLVTEVCPDEAVDDRARDLAAELATKAPLGIERALEAFNHALDVPLERGLDVEGYLASDLYATRDRKEGFEARIEGREPEFEGR